MLLTTKLERLYGGCGRSMQYFVYLDHNRVGNGDTKAQAEAMAKQTLKDAYEYITHSSIALTANDGTVIVFRQIADDQAMYEFCRNGERGHGCCMGRMTNGETTFTSLKAFAHYILSQHNGALND